MTYEEFEAAHDTLENEIGKTPFEKLVSAIQMLHSAGSMLKTDEYTRGAYFAENLKGILGAGTFCVYEAAMQLKGITLAELNEIVAYDPTGKTSQ